jgi:hypothetical protein
LQALFNSEGVLKVIGSPKSNGHNPGLEGDEKNWVLPIGKKGVNVTVCAHMCAYFGKLLAPYIYKEEVL